MSVYTPVSEAEATEWLRNYSVGTLVALEPIKAGIENSNFFVTTTQGRYVLTLFERLPAEELPFYLDLMAHLARHGIPSPAPIADLSDQYLQRLNGKPAALVTRLAGRSYPAYLENPRGPKWWRFAAAEVHKFLDPAQTRLLRRLLRSFVRWLPPGPPP